MTSIRIKCTGCRYNGCSRCTGCIYCSGSANICGTLTWDVKHGQFILVRYQKGKHNVSGETFEPKKFFLCESAKIKHFHPGVLSDLSDQTHKEARKFKKQDLKLCSDRRKKNIVWPLG